jgi:enoyl-[acyl-carrier protein] reductase II
VYSKTKALMARGTAFLGTEWAILCGAMSWVSERNLVAAISNAGGFGVIACGAMTPELLDTEITATKGLTSKPFGVNLITMHPALFDLIAVCARHRVSHVVLAGGIPPKGSVEAIKESGAKVICFAPTVALGKKLLRSGADALVIEGSEAGGHIGPVSTSVLAQEILPALASRWAPAARSWARASPARASPSPIRTSRRPFSGPLRAMPSRRSRSIRGCP